MRLLHKPIPDRDLKAAIKGMRIIVDTREQKNQHILDYFNAKKIPYVFRALEYGDYSCEIDLAPEHYHESDPAKPKSVSLEKYVVVERKNSIDELAGNLKQDKNAEAGDSRRLEREFIRAKSDACNVVLLLENFSFDRVFLGSEGGNYRSQMQPSVIVSNLNTFVARYDLHLITLNSNTLSGTMVVSLLSRYTYEYLKE